VVALDLRSAGIPPGEWANCSSRPHPGPTSGRCRRCAMAFVDYNRTHDPRMMIQGPSSARQTRDTRNVAPRAKPLTHSELHL